MIPLICQDCSKIFIGTCFKFCKKCSFNHSESIDNFLNELLSNKFLNLDIKLLKEYEIIKIKRLLYICKIYSNKILQSHQIYLSNFRILLKEFLKNYEMKDYVNWINESFGNENELLEMTNINDFKNWCKFYNYFTFPRHFIFKFCWNNEILSYILNTNLIYINWLFYKCDDGYLITEWLCFHYKSNKIDKNELIKMLIKLNIIYINHLNQNNTIKYQYYDWLYVFDDEIDICIYKYLMINLKYFITNIKFMKFIDHDYHIDIFNYIIFKKEMNWIDKVGWDYVIDYPYNEDLDFNFTYFILNSDFELIFENDSIILENISNYIQNKQLYYDLGHYFLNENNLKKSIYNLIKAEEYTLVFNLSRKKMYNYKNLDNIKNDMDFIMFLLNYSSDLLSEEREEELEEIIS
jgi:hypothetical protein